MTTPTTDSQDQSCACPEGRRALSRRGFLALSAAGVATATTVSGARVSFAASPAAGSTVGKAPGVLVVVSLRGGMDGLSAVVPSGDPGYYAARPSIGVPASRLKKVDSMFGLHPAMEPLYKLWDSRKMAAVQAVGQPTANGSHFAAMDALERADPGSALRTGWLDRYVGVRDTGDTFSAVNVGGGALPKMMLGSSAEFGMGSLNDVRLNFDEKVVPLAGWRSAMETLHKGTTNPLATSSVRTGLGAIDETKGVPGPGQNYPGSSLGNALKDVARLIKADIGVNAATVDDGQWDMHRALGPSDRGWMYDNLTDLSSALAAFAADLGDDLDRVTVMTVSEFGRRVAQNGSAGVDHGYGGLMLLLGGGLAGGKVYGNWPGLGKEDLDDRGNLAVTTDYRQVIAEILEKQGGVSTSTIFPDVPKARLGIMA
ncbi:MAG: DUF1501 domain-containing protein [Dermatophilaceae bacterium]